MTFLPRIDAMQKQNSKFLRNAKTLKENMQISRLVDQASNNATFRKARPRSAADVQLSYSVELEKNAGQIIEFIESQLVQKLFQRETHASF